MVIEWFDGVVRNRPFGCVIIFFFLVGSFDLRERKKKKKKKKKGRAGFQVALIGPIHDGAWSPIWIFFFFNFFSRMPERIGGKKILGAPRKPA